MKFVQLKAWGNGKDAGLKVQVPDFTEATIKQAAAQLAENIMQQLAAKK